MRSGLLFVLCLAFQHASCTQGGPYCSDLPSVDQCPWEASTSNATPAEVGALKPTSTACCSILMVKLSGDMILQCGSNLHPQAAPSAASSKPVQGSQTQSQTWTHEDVCGRLIVRFHGYKSVESHKADVAKALAGVGDAWKWVDRQNAAASFPTDFALLEVADTDTARVKVGYHTDALHINNMHDNDLTLC